MAPFRRLWARDLHQVVDPRTVVFAPMLLVQERATRVTRLDAATGEEVWEARVYNPWGWLRASATHVFYLNQHELLQCFDMSTGTPLWGVELVGDDPVYGNLVPLGDRVVVGGWRAYTHVHCLDARSGERLWSLPDLGDVAEPIPGPWGLAFPRIKPPPGDLTIIDPKTGERVAHSPLPVGTMIYDGGCSVQRYGGELLITTAQGEIYLLNPAHQQPPMLIGMHEPGIASITPTILDGIMVFQNGDRAVCVYDLSAGKVLWSAHVEPHRDWRIWRIRATRLENGQILIGTSEGRLRLYDPRGREIAAETVATRILTDIRTLRANCFVFGTKGQIVTYSLA